MDLIPTGAVFLGAAVVLLGLFPVLFYQLKALHRIERKMDEIVRKLPYGAFQQVKKR